MARIRKNKPGKGKRSHYLFKNWVFEKDERIALAVVPIRNYYPDLINTCLYNPSTNTFTLIYLTFDLDAHRAISKWKNDSGQLDWYKISECLYKNHPEIHKYIFCAVRSSGGKGIGLGLAISPMELTKETITGQRTARQLQSNIVSLLNYYCMGADPGALGLKRDMCNFFDGKRVLGGDIKTLYRVHKERPAVVTDLLKYTRSLEALKYQKKKEDQENYLYPDIRAEKKLSNLYIKLYEEWQNSSEDKLTFKISEIAELTGCSQPFLRKFLKTSNRWMTSEFNHGEGWELVLLPDTKLTRRAYSLQKGVAPKYIKPTLDLQEEIIEPESVTKERNKYLSTVSLKLKHSGFTQSETTDIVDNLIIPRIPQNESSQNCRKYSQIVHNIFKNFPNNEAIFQSPTGAPMAGSLPDWLHNLAVERRDFKNETKLMKGGYPLGPLARASKERNLKLCEKPPHDGLESPTSCGSTLTKGGARGGSVNSRPKMAQYSQEDLDYFSELLKASYFLKPEEKAVFEAAFEGGDWKNTTQRLKGLLKKKGVKLPSKQGTTALLNKILCKSGFQFGLQTKV